MLLYLLSFFVNYVPKQNLWAHLTGALSKAPMQAVRWQIKTSNVAHDSAPITQAYLRNVLWPKGGTRS